MTHKGSSRQVNAERFPETTFVTASGIATLAAATIAGAWFFQLVLGIRPCPLCLEQRYAYYFAIPFASLLTLGTLLEMPGRLLRIGFIILALAFLANAIFGGYHAGIEWGFWRGPSDCTGPITDFGSAASLLDDLNKVKVVLCNEVQWKLLGLSLAGYNVLISMTAVALASWGALASKRNS